MRILFLLPALFIINIVFAQSAPDKSADILFVKGDAQFSKSQFDSAAASYGKALAIYQREKMWSRVATCQNKISETYFNLIKYNDAFQAASQAIKICQEHPEVSKEEEAHASINLGKIHIVRAENTEAVTCYKKALTLQKEIYGEEHSNVAKAYQYVSEGYGYDGHYDQALSYSWRALAINKKIYGEKSPEVAFTYYDIASLYNHTDRHAEAVKYDLLALKIFKRTIGENNMDVANVYRNLGMNYVSLNQFDDVIDTQKKGLAIYRKISPGNPRIILFYWNLGDAYAHIGQHNEAKRNYQLAVTTIQNIFGDKHPGLVSSYTYFASYYNRVGDYNMALNYYQKSITANLPHFNNQDPYSHPKLENALWPDGLFNSLIAKADVLNKIHADNKDIRTVKEAFVTYQLIDTLLGNLRQSHRDVADKIRVSKKAATAYENAIATSLKIYDALQDKRYLAAAFYFSEKSKVGVLTSVLADLSAKGRGLIPDSVLQFEKSLTEKITQYQSLIANATQHDSDTLALEQLKSKLFNIRVTFDSLQEKMEVNFPKYHQVKNSTQTVTVEFIQSRIQESSALLEYFEGDHNIYVFNITKNEFNVYTLPRDSVYDGLVKQYRESLLNGGTQSVAGDFEKYVSSATVLYELLIKNSMSDKKPVDNILIIPDGQLAYIPFDVLITKKSNAQPGHYRELPYLLKRYAVNYHYSASLYFKNVTRQSKATNDYLLMAPAYGNIKSDTISMLALGKFRDEVSALKWNKREVELIAEKIGGDFFSGDDATESKFKSSAKDYRVLHLAMHALIDDQDPMNSEFVFSHEKDTANEDGYLHAFELYNMELNAQMVVLSACKTGYGQLAKGEGVMSLARAFSVSGVPSVVMSHWNVDDEATSKLMAYFYANLAEGMTKDKALQEAKLKYLEEANPTAAAPFYWAAFVNVGDNSPVISTNHRWLLATLLASLIIISVAMTFIVYSRKKRSLPQIAG
jgi:CHAT domain-containing protein